MQLFQNPAGVARANFSIRVIESVGGTSTNQVCRSILCYTITSVFESHGMHACSAFLQHRKMTPLSPFRYKMLLVGLTYQLPMKLSMTLQLRSKRNLILDHTSDLNKVSKVFWSRSL